MEERQGNKRSPLSVFISYAHEDESLRQRLETHLSLLRRQGLIADWHDRQVMPGAEWAQEIDEHLETASIVLLLISADFVASDYCYNKEMKRALERHKLGEARVIPIILRPCDWQSSPFARLQSLPRDGKAITTWQNQDEAFLVIAEGLRQVIERQQIPTRPLSHVERQNRTRLMKRVRAVWIEGVLEHSLHQAALIALNLQERPDALENPWHLEVQETNLPPRLLPAGTSIIEVYDKADGELLILGEPGAGKTTLLLELARTLLDRAQADERHRIPVVFNLSSWAQGRQSLAVWLVEELWTKYQVPRKVGQAWIDTNQVLLLLDGLDEVAENARSACVRAINAYYQCHLEKGLAPLVVCCRSKEYAALPTRVTLRRAVSIQPLTPDQIDHYLQSTKGQLEALRHVLREDAELYDLACRPLMLSIFTLAYQEVTPEDLPTGGTREGLQQQVFATYVERMLTRRGQLQSGKQEQFLHWLIHVAKQMNRQQQTVFSVEYLQLDWLPAKQQHLCQWSLRLIFGLVFSLAGGLFITCVIRLLFAWASWPLVVGISGLLAILWVCGPLTLYVSSRDGSRIQPAEVIYWKNRLTNRVHPSPNEGIRLSGRSGLLIGVLVILLLVILRVVLSILSNGLFFGLLSWLFFGLLGWLFFGLSTNQLIDRAHPSPNEGIRLSGRSGLLIGILAGLRDGLFGGLVFGPIYGLLAGPATGLLFGLREGLDAFVQHFVLRFWLWRTNCLPWNLVPFLDEAAERLLLRKVGGSYIFVHRLLLNYFTSLEQKEP